MPWHIWARRHQKALWHQKDPIRTKLSVTDESSENVSIVLIVQNATRDMIRSCTKSTKPEKISV